MDPAGNDAKPTTARLWLLLLSVVSVVACAAGAACHYRKWAWGNFAHPTGWLLSMLFLVLAFAPAPRQAVARVKSALNARAVFFAAWVLVFTISRLWHFKTAPWNGNGLFDESGWDLWFFKSYVVGHPFQPAWFHSPISRETLFHYYLWPFFGVFGYNILSYEIGLFVIWATTFLFTLLLVDELFRSNVVTGLTALVFNFLPFAFIYTFAGYRYPMATALCVVSLYFLHRGFRRESNLDLSLGGMAAGLCLASSISGKQYLVVLLLCAVLYPALNRKTWKWKDHWRSIGIVTYGCLVAAMPILCYIAFNRQDYTLYESSFLHSFWQAVRGHPDPNSLSYYTTKLWGCFFKVPGERFFIPDFLPIPLPYFCFLVPGLALALWQKRFDIALLGTVPIAGAFIAAAFENRLLLAIPFWMILMALAFAALLKLRLRPAFRFVLWGMAAVVVVSGVVPSIKYISKKAKYPLSIYHFAQPQVAVSRFLRSIVAGREPSDPPRRERDEFNRAGSVDPSYDTLICQSEAYSIIHLFLHDYDDAKVLSPSNGLPFILIPEQELWTYSRNAIVGYVPRGKDLKLVWEVDLKTDRIINKLRSAGDLATESSVSFSFVGRQKRFFVLNIPANNVRPFQGRVQALPEPL
jgi:hypothetical protein